MNNKNKNKNTKLQTGLQWANEMFEELGLKHLVEEVKITEPQAVSVFNNVDLKQIKNKPSKPRK